MQKSDPEIEAMSGIHTWLARLDEEACQRVVNWVVARWGRGAVFRRLFDAVEK